MDALAHSINVATVNIGMSVGIDKVAETLRLIGIPEARIQKNLSMLLGTAVTRCKPCDIILKWKD
ncbi:hypothetical protein SODG_003842 [Sodalis praecaptivus]